MWQSKVDILEIKGGSIALNLCGPGIFTRLAEVEEAGDTEVFDGISEGRLAWEQVKSKKIVQDSGID